MTTGSEKVYNVKSGKHDFKPNSIPFPFLGANKYEFLIRFDSSQWWSIEDTDYPYGNDIYDWNKAGGLTNYLSANNKQSVLIGWRPAKEYMVMEITAYVNDKSGGFKTGPIVKIPVGVNRSGWIKQFGSVAYFDYGGQRVSMKARKPFIIREIGPWFGGNRPAHKDMKFFLSKNIR